MRIIYPFNPCNINEADEPYHKECKLMKSRGINCSLFDFDGLQFDEFSIKPKIRKGELIVYRGWMLSPDMYLKLTAFITKAGGLPVTSYDDYMKCHHMPGWYNSCSDLTPETKFFSNDQDLEKNVTSLGWDKYFIKDYVKSNSDKRGSFASTPAEVTEVVNLIELYRGSIEGGVAVRRAEDFNVKTECRHFVVNGKVFSPSKHTPDIVYEVAKRVSSRFFSIDVIQTHSGEYRIVELGDGQVSDKKNWDLCSFHLILKGLAPKHEIVKVCQVVSYECECPRCHSVIEVSDEAGVSGAISNQSCYKCGKEFSTLCE